MKIMPSGGAHSPNQKHVLFPFVLWGQKCCNVTTAQIDAPAELLLERHQGMSEYKLMRMQRVHRNNTRLASLGLLAPMTSAASLSSDRSNSKKRSAPQDDVERLVQPTRNAKKRHLTGILTTMSSTR
jgi:hypothetical protein